ncbi:MAG: S8 family serine peptidase, partial [Chitinophagaceae bacterium]
AVISSFSSWGPTDDGRIKPDIVGAGVSVLSTNSSTDDAYGTSSGTSMSAPNVSGSLFLLQEHYAKTNGNRFMRSASLKGLAIHTANECGTNAGPDYIFGWGLLNTLKAAEVISSKNTGNHLLREEVLNNGASHNYQVVASGRGKLVVTISWTDVKGEVAFTNYLNNRTPRLVNDLDVRVSLNGETFFPWKLDPANPAAAALKGDNILDNVEKIEIDNPIPGATYTITVSHKNTLARGLQAYSLLASGVGGTAFCNSTPTSTAGTRIDSVVIGTVRFNNPNNGCTNYAVFGSGNVLIRPGETLNLKVGVSACDATQADRIIKTFIDFNGNNIFDANELVGTSS